MTGGNESGLVFGSCCDGSCGIGNGARCRRFMKFGNELRDRWHASPAPKLMHR